MIIVANKSLIQDINLLLHKYMKFLQKHNFVKLHVTSDSDWFSVLKNVWIDPRNIIHLETNIYYATAAVSQDRISSFTIWSTLDALTRQAS